MSYCGLCKHYNDWEHTYVKMEFPFVVSCCSYWHTAYSSKNTARRQKSCFVSKQINHKQLYVQLTFDFKL